MFIIFLILGRKIKIFVVLYLQKSVINDDMLKKLLKRNNFTKFNEKYKSSSKGILKMGVVFIRF